MIRRRKTPAETRHVAQATENIRSASASAIDRALHSPDGPPDSGLLSGEIHHLYLGHGWQPPPMPTAPPCTEHPFITPPCPICRT